ncbi:hypothetical protein RQP46_002771 [Phenoliferia psychrophenolica]
MSSTVPMLDLSSGKAPSSTDEDSGRPLHSPPQKPFQKGLRWAGKQGRTVKAALREHPAATLMTAIIAVMLGIGFGVFYGYQGNVYLGRAFFTADSNTTDSGNGGLLLFGQVLEIDADAGNFVISWQFDVGCGSPDLFANTSDSGTPGVVCGPFLKDLNVYINDNASTTFVHSWRVGRYEANSSDYFMLPDGTIWLTNWIITLVIVWTTAKIVLFGSNLPPELILVPITALFSLPAVRATMPNAPDFGSYMASAAPAYACTI